MKWRFLTAVCIGLMSLLSFSDGKPTYSAQATSSIEEYTGPNGHLMRTIVTSSFQVMRVDLPPKGLDYEVLFKQRVEVMSEESMEGQTSSILIEAFKKNNGVYSDILWSLKEPFDAAGLASLGDWDCYHTVKYGCCGGENTSHYYDLASGRLILACTGSPAVLSDGTYDSARIAAYYAPEAVVPPEGVVNWAKYQGMISYYSFARPLCRAMLVSGEFPSLYPISMTLEKTSLRVADSNGHYFRVPIDHDRFVVGEVKGNCRIKLSEAPMNAR